MATMELVVDRPQAGWVDFSKGRNQSLLIEAIRLGFLFVALTAFLIVQHQQKEFVNFEVWQPIFWLLTGAFLLHYVYLVFYENTSRDVLANGAVFGFDTLLVGALIFHTGTLQSVFLFLFLINIILCGLVFQKKGAVTLSLWTSIMYSSLLIFGPEVPEQNIYMSLGLNNLAFFSVALLSGSLSEQLQFIGAELKEKGQDLQALRELNEMIVTNVSTGLITTDRIGYISLANRSASRIFSDISLTGKDIGEFLPNMAKKLTKSELVEGSQLNRFEVEYDNGRDKMILEVIISHLKHPKKGHTGYVFLLQDLTQMKNLEFAMRQQEKMAAVGQLAAGIAHEIRNPLASVSGSIQLLAASAAVNTEEDKKLVNITLKEIDRLNNLISEFLDFVRPEVLKTNPVDLNQLMGEVMDIVKVNDQLPGPVDQVKELDAKISILGHYDKLKQAMLNIVINAYQATEKVEKARVKVSTWSEGSQVFVRVQDNGQGMPAKFVSRVFEPFHTTKAGGTGLGLAITHKIIESHDGKIHVESKEGQGTTFTLQFPAENDGEGNKVALLRRA